MKFSELLAARNALVGFTREERGVKGGSILNNIEKNSVQFQKLLEFEQNLIEGII